MGSQVVSTGMETGNASHGAGRTCSGKWMLSVRAFVTCIEVIMVRHISVR